MTGVGQWPVPLARATGRVTGVCVPYAGARPGVFVPLARAVSGVDVVATQLPGHGMRLREASLTSLTEIAEGLAVAIGETVTGPYVVLGHRMGALVGVEQVRALQDGPAPEHLIVSACRAPAELKGDHAWHRLPDDDLPALTALCADPAPLAVLELRELALPAIRADLEAVESFDKAPRPKVNCPITAISGTADPDAKPELMAAWERETQGGFTARSLAGGHFLLEERPADMVGIVRDVLDRN